VTAAMVKLPAKLKIEPTKAQLLRRQRQAELVVLNRVMAEIEQRKFEEYMLTLKTQNGAEPKAERILMGV